MTNWSRKWLLFAITIVFAVTWAVWKMWQLKCMIYHVLAYMAISCCFTYLKSKMRLLKWRPNRKFLCTTCTKILLTLFFNPWPVNDVWPENLDEMGAGVGLVGEFMVTTQSSGHFCLPSRSLSISGVDTSANSMASSGSVPLTGAMFKLFLKYECKNLC